MDKSNKELTELNLGLIIYDKINEIFNNKKVQKTLKGGNVR